MVGALFEKKGDEKSALSVIQTLIVSTATRVGMGNLVGVVAAISAGGAGAVFWMWLTALIGSSTAFIEATLAQIYKEKDPLYGGTEVVQLITFTVTLKKNRKAKTLCSCFRTLCHFWFNMLVRYQSGRK